MTSEGDLHVNDALAFGDIVLVAFPFTNQVMAKPRPAVVISNKAYNLARPDVVLMAVTSRIQAAASPSDVPIVAWEASGLIKPSAIKLVIATLERGLVRRMLGSLASDDQAALRRVIGEMLG